MQPENDNRYPQLSVEEQLELATRTINCMTRYYLQCFGHKPVKPMTTAILEAASLLGAYSGETTGRGTHLRDEWAHTQEDWPEYMMPTPMVPKWK